MCGIRFLYHAFCHHYLLGTSRIDTSRMKLVACFRGAEGSIGIGLALPRSNAYD